MSTPINVSVMAYGPKDRPGIARVLYQVCDNTTVVQGGWRVLVDQRHELEIDLSLVPSGAITATTIAILTALAYQLDPELAVTYLNALQQFGPPTRV